MPDERKRILLVDDSELLLEMASAALSEAGFEVSTAQDLNDLDRIETGDDHDLILMDVQMPELFGDDVASVLRHVRGVRAPIYLLSDLDEAELAQRAANAQIEGYISKRRGLEALVERVNAILAGSEPGAEREQP